MPLLGIGLIKKSPGEYMECSEFHFRMVMKKIERVFNEHGYYGYCCRSYPYGERNSKYDIIQYAKTKNSILLSRVSMSIEYVSNTSQIPHKIKIEPLCGNDIFRWRERGMEIADLISDLFIKIGFKCVYYCSYEAVHDNTFFATAEYE